MQSIIQNMLTTTKIAAYYDVMEVTVGDWHCIVAYIGVTIVL